MGLTLQKNGRRDPDALDFGLYALINTQTGEPINPSVGYCFTADGLDINRAIIEQGFALACPRYDTRYVKYEKLGTGQTRAAYCERRR